MSLHVYLVLDGPPRTTAELAERLFIRRDGATVEITRGEWDEMFPDRAPTVAVMEMDARYVYERNITHNLGRMASECGLYEPLWRPENIPATHARDLVAPLREGFGRLIDERERLLEFNPSNGWGDYDLLVRFTEDYLAACLRWPDARIEVSR